MRYLANQGPYADGLDDLLARGEACGHDFVLGELLIGDKGRRKPLLIDYRLMHQAPPVPHRDVVEFVQHRRLHGRGVGWMDAHLLASALVGGVALWTADPRLAAVARELAVSHD
jgi:predicted nucleic acid-binding protein